MKYLLSRQMMHFNLYLYSPEAAGHLMSRLHPLAERHAVEKLGWLRAAVLGANDGTLSTGSLIVGVASSHATRGSILIAGLSALVAGALGRVLDVRRASRCSGGRWRDCRRRSASAPSTACDVLGYCGNDRHGRDRPPVRRVTPRSKL
jgi:hypothetical protein